MARQLKRAESRRVGETERQTEKHRGRYGQKGRDRATGRETQRQIWTERERQTEKHSSRGGQRGRDRQKNTVAEMDREGETDRKTR